MKNLWCPSRTSEVNLTNRLKDMEEKISDLEDKVEKMNRSDGKNVIS